MAGVPVQITATGAIGSGPQCVKHLVLTAAGAAATATFYDGTDASGTALLTMACPANDMRDVDEDWVANTAVWCVITGAGAKVTAYV